MTFPLPTNWADAGATWDATNINQVGSAVNDIAGTSMTAASAGITTTQTQLLSQTVPLSTLSVGSTFELAAYGTMSTKTGTTSVTWQIHLGTNNTTLDTVINSVAVPTNGSSVGSMVEGMLTVRTTGATGTCIASMSCNGGNAGAAQAVGTTTTLANTTVANHISLSVALNTTHNTFTVQQAYISQGGQ